MLQKLIYYFTPKTYDSQLHVPRSFLRMCELMSLMKPGVPSKVEQVNGRCLNACKLDCSSSEALADGASVHPSMCSAVSGSLAPILWHISRVSAPTCGFLLRRVLLNGLGTVRHSCVIRPGLRTQVWLFGTVGICNCSGALSFQITVTELCHIRYTVISRPQYTYR